MTEKTTRKPIYKPKFICPRCRSERVQETTVFHSKTKYTRITCTDCKFTIEGLNNNDVETLWRISKENRLKHAIRSLREFGNTYVGRLTLEEWKNDDMLAYLNNETKLNIGMRDPELIGGGAVLYVDCSSTKQKHSEEQNWPKRTKRPRMYGGKRIKQKSTAGS